jgi:biotin synthase
MDKREIETWLRETGEACLDELWHEADAARWKHVGDAVHLRGLIEISSHCVRQCRYCGLRQGHDMLERYRMTEDEILDSARLAAKYGYGTVVMQAGEDYGITRHGLSQVIRRIKSETDVAITLSMGERPGEDLLAWREAGADRYLLRFETSDAALYEKIHPSLHGRLSDRLAMLRQIKALGYETGSGIMVGIPGQTYAALANDIDLFRTLDLEMIGLGPFIAHPETPIGRCEDLPVAPDGEQVPNSELMTYKVLALTRLVCPDANIPSTTALATINRDTGRLLGLSRGANVIMPNVTPQKYRKLYEIYPAKASSDESSEETRDKIMACLRALGRPVGTGPGGRIR